MPGELLLIYHLLHTWCDTEDFVCEMSSVTKPSNRRSLLFKNYFQFLHESKSLSEERKKKELG